MAAQTQFTDCERARMMLPEETLYGIHMTGKHDIVAKAF